MVSSSSLLRTFRAIHLYVGVFTAPALLFFAFTGALQTLSLHETTRGSSYQPPRWAVVLGQLHKKQTMVVPQRRPGGAPQSAPTSGPSASPSPTGGATNQSQARPSSEARKGPSPVPLKAFFLLVCVGLASSTVTGIYMSFGYRRPRGVIVGLLIAGTILPILLAFV